MSEQTIDRCFNCGSKNIKLVIKDVVLERPCEPLMQPITFKGKLVGHIVNHGDHKVYRTIRSEARNQRLWKLDAFGISTDVIQQLDVMGIREVHIHYYNKGTKIIYMGNLTQWIEGKKEVFEKGDSQRFVTRSHLNVLGERSMKGLFKYVGD